MVLEFDSQAEKFRVHSAEVQSFADAISAGYFPFVKDISVGPWVRLQGNCFPPRGDSNSA